MVGEDVEDDRRAIDHGHAGELLEVALLAGGKLIVAGDQVGVGLGDRLLELLDLALAEIVGRLRASTLLDDFAGHCHAGRAQELLELGKLVPSLCRGRRQHRDAESALARPRVHYARGVSLRVARACGAALTSRALHSVILEALLAPPIGAAARAAQPARLSRMRSTASRR